MGSLPLRNTTQSDNELKARIASLSPKQKELFEQLLGSRNAGSNNHKIPKKDQNEYPLSPAQKRMWFLAHTASGRDLYNVHFSMQLGDRIDIGIIRKSLQLLIQRHDILRTTFHINNGEPFQKISRQNKVNVEIVNTKAASTDTIREIIREVSQQEFKFYFDLENGPLVRIVLLTNNSNFSCLFVTMHHLVADAWSVEIFKKELSIVYQAFAMKRIPDLRVLNVHYGDYAMWQIERLNKPELNRSLEFWVKKLQDLPRPIQLCVDKERPTHATFRGGQCRMTLDRLIKKRILGAAQEQKVSLFIFLLSAFKVLLFRYTGSPDLLIGTPVANRINSEMEDIMGYFVNVLVIRSNPSGEIPFYSWVQQMRKIVLESMIHEEVPFDKLLEHLHIKRDLSHHPVYQVSCQLINLTLQKAAYTPESPYMIEVEKETIDLDLAVNFFNTNDELIIQMEYSKDVFNADRIHKMLQHFKNILLSVTADINLRIDEISLLETDEFQKIVYGFNQTKQIHASSLKLPDLVFEAIDLHPDRHALVTSDFYITYKELGKQVIRLAKQLKQMNAQRGKVIGICMGSKPEMVIGILGILVSGATYLPLDKGLPKDRMSKMISDSKASFIIADPDMVSLFTTPECQIPVITYEAKEIIETDASTYFSIAPGYSKKDLAYVMYTSGSSGSPKGVMVSHESICNHLLWMKEQLPLETNDRVIQKYSICFDPSVWEIFGTLICGATLVLSGNKQNDPSALTRMLIDFKITAIDLTPSMLQLMVSNPAFEQAIQLRRITCGGESLTLELLKQVKNCCKAQLYNFYGPTEATIAATCFSCNTLAKNDPLTVGFPIYNTQVYVLDIKLNPLPCGVKGEIFIGGKGVSEGYINNSKLSAEKFIGNPFVPEERMYKTGDTGTLLENGSLMWLGRNDRQIKLHGIRIEPEEIESLILEYEGIRHVRVISKDYGEADHRLFCFLVCYEIPVSFEDLSLFLQRKLPVYMVPSMYIMLDELPVNANGKTDDKFLLEKVPHLRYDESIPITYEPITSLQQSILQIWKEVLKCNQISLDEDFFMIGGHSLLLVSLQLHLEKSLGYKVELMKFFEYPTVRLMAIYLENIS